MHLNTKSQPQLNIIDDINVKNADICLDMEIKLKGLIFILDAFLISLEIDLGSNHKYTLDGISNLNILLDLLLEDNQKLEENQKHIFEILNQLN